jgi:putative methyltransferase (TIGR04325 family)
MKKTIKKTIKLIIPAKYCKMYRKFFPIKSPYGFFGNYKTWAEAKADSTGYDDEKILEKVKNNLLKVKHGEAVYERDSVIFDTIQYSWPLLASLLWITSKNKNRLNLIDFGGSLGSAYFQNIGFLKHLEELRWNIVEQNNFTECGKKYFEDESLKFFTSIDNCLKETTPKTILLSSSVQYLEDPYSFLKNLIPHDFDYIIFDRTTFLQDSERITLQKVPPGIYPASYPAWFLHEKKFLDIFKEKYMVKAEWDALGGKRNLGDIESFEKGFIFVKK